MYKAAELAHQKQYEPSTTQLTLLVHADAENANLHLALGEMLLRQEDWDQALDEFTEATRLMPGFPEVHNRLAYIFSRSDDPESAIAEARTALSMDPGNAEAYRYLGLARVEQHNTAGAAEALKKAEELAPSGATKLAMARLYAEQKDYPKAEAALADGASGDEVDYVLGLIRLGQGRNDEAVRNLEAFLSKNPDHAYGHYYAGMAYNAMHRSDKMLSHFELFVRMKPDAPESRKVRAVLQTGR